MCSNVDWDGYGKAIEVEASDNDGCGCDGNTDMLSSW